MLGWLVAFDVLGVGLSLLISLLALVDRRYESSSLLDYVLWIVVGMFAGTVITMGHRSDGDFDSPSGQAEGKKLVFVTAGVAFGLALLSSLVWSSSEFAEPVPLDHRGVTLTYLSTVVLIVAGAHFWLFKPEKNKPGSRSVSASSPRVLSRLPRLPAPLVPARARAPVRGEISAGAEAFSPEEKQEPFRPAGFGLTVAFLFGVPTLLFLDAGFFVLGPFDALDRYTDPILTAALAGGLLWGALAARRELPRQLLFLLHAPLLLGTLFYFFCLLAGGLLVAFGVSERAVEVLTYLAFGVGFLLGSALVYLWFGERLASNGSAVQE